MSDKPEAPVKPEADKPDYRSTVFLPKTDFPMKAGLPQKEPVIAARWKEQDLYGQVRKTERGGRSSSSTTARPTPMATSISAM